MKNLLKQVFDEMRLVEILNPITNEYWEIQGEDDHFWIRKNNKVFANEVRIEEVGYILAPIYRDFIHRTEKYLLAVKDGGYWKFLNHFAIETDVGFEKGEWFVINGGDLVFTSSDLIETKNYLLEKQLDLETSTPFCTLDDPRIMDSATAAEKWGIDSSYIRHIIDQFPPGTIRKFGKQWVVTVEGMYYVFGMPKKKGDRDDS